MAQAQKIELVFLSLDIDHLMELQLEIQMNVSNSDI
jgi:hypothetical protein